MTTSLCLINLFDTLVVEAYRLDRYDNIEREGYCQNSRVVEAYRLDRYDNVTP